jgi:caffeoyl-CoA O-methyltransferase
MPKFNDVMERVEAECTERHIPMLGRDKAIFLADLVTSKRPSLVVECGSAIGYSGLWIADRLRAIDSGCLLTVEVDAGRVSEARANYEAAELSGWVDIRDGDAQRVLSTIEEEVDFLFLDNNFGNYLPCYRAIEDQLVDGATILADNVGIGENEMRDYLDHVRANFESETHWFEVGLPWVDRDAMEVSIYTR